MNQARINELVELIQKARYNYYNLDPQISDQEYDALVDELKRLQPDNPQVKAIGAPVQTYSVWEKVKHEIPMGSLDKVNSPKEFEAWVNKNSIDLSKTGLHPAYKVDGSSMELVYENGNLVRAVTRGDGIIGEDVTSNMLKVPTILKKLSKPASVTIRGEVVMFKKVFEEKYANQYANPRNTAAGKVRDKKNDGADCVNLNFLAYGLHGMQCKTMEEMFKELENLGFQTPRPTYPLCSLQELMETVSKNRDSIPYEIDGMVISINDLRILEELGELNMRPLGQIAWKFDPAMGITTVLDIKWQIGNSGRVTPVASIAPVNIGGVTITSVSLHNMALFNDLKLFKGCRVLVSRRNDVIPYLEKNLDNQ